MAQQNKRGRGGSWAAGLIAGALAGASVALLFTPKLGRETRDIVRRKSRDYYGFIREKLSRNQGGRS